MLNFTVFAEILYKVLIIFKYLYQTKLVSFLNTFSGN
jgi:hypothetical protein